MPDLVCSVYTKDYKWWENVERPAPTKGFNIAIGLMKKNAKFLTTKALKPSLGEESRSVIQNLHRLRMKTVYRADYCEERFPKADAARDPLTALKEDELMDSMARVLDPEPRKLLPPPDTTPVVFGFCPVRRFHTSRTFYTDVHSRPAYESLRRSILQRGLCRLAPAPRHHLEPDYSTPPCLKVKVKGSRLIVLTPGTLCVQGKALPPPTWIHLKPDPHS